MVTPYLSCVHCDRLALVSADRCPFCGHAPALSAEQCPCARCERKRLAAPPRSGQLARPEPWWLLDPECYEPGPLPGCPCAWCAAKVGEAIARAVG